MKKIGLFYGSATTKTTAVAEKLKEAFRDDEVNIIPVEYFEEKDFEAYEYIIAGSSTWFDGELPTYWDEIMPELIYLDMKGKKVAIFGLGDQVNYPDNFVDGVGILADVFTELGATLVGFTSAEGYHFNRSKALKKGEFAGLVLDFENQPDQTDERIRKWVSQLKKEFENERSSVDELLNC